jgi:hypothetical protein
MILRTATFHSDRMLRTLQDLLGIAGFSLWISAYCRTIGISREQGAVQQVVSKRAVRCLRLNHSASCSLVTGIYQPTCSLIEPTRQTPNLPPQKFSFL